MSDEEEFVCTRCVGAGETIDPDTYRLVPCEACSGAGVPLTGVAGFTGAFDGTGPHGAPGGET